MKDYFKFQGDLSKLKKDELKELFLKLENYRLRYRNDINISKEISFGLEIEFEKAILKEVETFLANIISYKYYSVHEDKTVTIKENRLELGGEVSTDILHNSKKEWDDLYNLFKYLKHLGCKTTSNTAFQMHVGAQIFNEDLEYVKRFIKVWCIFEDIIFRFSYGKTSVPRAKINYYAEPLLPTFKMLYENDNNIFSKIKTTKMLDFGKNNAVNFKNYHYLTSEEEYGNTIEIRCPNGLLEANIAQNTINFFLKLMLYVTSDKYDEKLIDKLFQEINVISLRKYSDFNINKALFLGDLIFDNTLDKINFLKQYVKKDDYIYFR